MGGREDQIWRHQHTRAPTETYFPGAGVQSSNFDGRSSKRISASKHSTFDSLGGNFETSKQARPVTLKKPK